MRCIELSITVVCQFVTEGSDQSIVKPVVEYCVVCGDKASGRDLFLLYIFLLTHISTEYLS